MSRTFAPLLGDDLNDSEKLGLGWMDATTLIHELMVSESNFPFWKYWEPKLESSMLSGAMSQKRKDGIGETSHILSKSPWQVILS